MPVQHRETVEEQGVEAVLLGVGESHVELLSPLGDETRSGRFLAKQGPGHAPHRLPLRGRRRARSSSAARAACG